MAKKKKPKLIICEWVDATTMQNGWRCVSEMEKEDCYKILSAGLLLRETKDTLYISTSYSDGEFNGGIMVPKKWIVRRKTYPL